jgi:large subunit ribosomal protein L4
MNRKERRLALRTAFQSRSEDLIVVENFATQLAAPKTKELVNAMSRWGVEAGEKVLLVLTEMTDNVYLSARNIASVKMVPADGLNIFDILNAGKIVVTSEALAKIQEVYND